jgi:hypothetical protein
VTTADSSARTLTADLLARLDRHYIKPGEAYPGGVFIPEVGWNGGTANSRCDAIYVGFTGSSGRLLIGHEVKVTRADWRRELDHPGKADAWADQCHAWYVVAPSTAVVKPEELPHGWGLLTINPRTTVRLDVTVKAAVHADRAPSWDAVRSVLSRADTLRAQAIVDGQQKARADAFADIDQRVRDRLASRIGSDHETRACELGERLTRIQEALGLDIDIRDDVAWARAGTATLNELRAAATFLRGHVNAAHAAQDLAGRYASPLTTIRQHLTELDTAIASLTTDTTSAEEASA